MYRIMSIKCTRIHVFVPLLIKGLDFGFLRIVLLIDPLYFDMFPPLQWIKLHLVSNLYKRLDVGFIRIVLLTYGLVDDRSAL